MEMGRTADDLPDENDFRANLFAINAAYWLLVMTIGGGLTAAFHG